MHKNLYVTACDMLMHSGTLPKAQCTIAIAGKVSTRHAAGALTQQHPCRYCSTCTWPFSFGNTDSTPAILQCCGAKGASCHVCLALTFTGQSVYQSYSLGLKADLAASQQVGQTVRVRKTHRKCELACWHPRTTASRQLLFCDANMLAHTFFEALKSVLCVIQPAVSQQTTFSWNQVVCSVAFSSVDEGIALCSTFSVPLPCLFLQQKQKQAKGL